MDLDLELVKQVMKKVRDDTAMDNVQLHNITWDDNGARKERPYFASYDIKDFRDDEIRCAFIVLYDAGLLSGHLHITTQDNRTQRDIPKISGLTSKGYDFLANLETTSLEEGKTVFEKIKEKIPKVSFDIAIALSSELAKKFAFRICDLG